MTMHGRGRVVLLLILLAALAALGLGIALTTGSVHVGPKAVVQALVGSGSGVQQEVVRRLRLPRALAAIFTGGLLGLSGALMQALLRNPLADPYVLGVSGAAAVGALGAMFVGAATPFINISAMAGALAAIMLLLTLARGDFARTLTGGAMEASPRLLLTGVVLAAGWGAIITLILTLAPQGTLRGMLFWLMGDLNGAQSWLPAMLTLAVALVVVCPAARELNVLLRGEAIAHSLGVRVVRLRRTVYLVASVAAALAVTTAGTIGFVGLVIPHALRLALGNDQRILLPASAFAGGTFLLLADTAARTLLAPRQLPVGVITALMGVPVFIFLLSRIPRPPHA